MSQPKGNERQSSGTKAEGNLSPASQSTDPKVQQLLAERASHQASGDSQKLAQVDRQLKDMGVAADQ